MQKTLILQTLDAQTVLERLPNGILLTFVHYAKAQGSRLRLIGFFCLESMVISLFLVAAIVMAYFTLYHVTLDCQRSHTQQPAICNVTKHYYLRPNEQILTDTAIKSITLDYDNTGTGTCRLALMTTTNQNILPLGDSYSSQQCRYNTTVKALQPFLNLDNSQPQTGSKTVKFNDNLLSWLGTGVLIALFFAGTWMLFKEGYLWQVRLDSQRRQLLLDYMRPFSDYQVTVPLSDVQELVFKVNADSEKPPKHPYFLLSDGKKIPMPLYGKIAERQEIVSQINALIQ